MNINKASYFIYLTLAFVIISNIATCINLKNTTNRMTEVLEATEQILHKEPVIKQLAYEEKAEPKPIIEFYGPNEIKGEERIILHIRANGYIKDFNISEKDIDGLESFSNVSLTKLSQEVYRLILSGSNKSTRSNYITILEGVATDINGNKSERAKYRITPYSE